MKTVLVALLRLATAASECNYKATQRAFRKCLNDHNCPSYCPTRATTTSSNLTTSHSNGNTMVRPKVPLSKRLCEQIHLEYCYFLKGKDVSCSCEACQQIANVAVACHWQRVSQDLIAPSTVCSSTCLIEEGEEPYQGTDSMASIAAPATSMKPTAPVISTSETGQGSSSSLGNRIVAQGARIAASILVWYI